MRPVKRNFSFTYFPGMLMLTVWLVSCYTGRDKYGAICRLLPDVDFVNWWKSQPPKAI